MAYTFTREDRQNGANATNLVRRERQAANAQRRQLLDWLADTITEQEMPAALLAACATAMDRSIKGELPEPESYLDRLRLMQMSEGYFKMYRLATGQSTSNAAVANLSAEHLADRLAALEAEQAPPTTDG